MKLFAAFALCLAACSSLPRAEYDVVLRGGTIYDGTGAAPRTGDVAIRGDRIVAVGEVPGRGAREIDLLMHCPPDEPGVLRGHFSSEVGGNIYSQATGKWYR